MSSSALSFDIKKLKLPGWLSFGSAVEAGGASLTVNYPPVAMGMSADRLALVRLVKDKSKKWGLTSWEIVEVPPELVEIDVFRVKIKSPDRFRALVAGALQKEGIRTPAISLVLPDHLARVSLLQFEELPRTRKDLMDMVRWKMKKAVPFKVEEAIVDYQVMPGAFGKGFTVLAVLIPGSIIEEHESIFLQQGIHPGLIDLSSLSLAHLYRPVIDKEVPVGGDFMMLNVDAAFFTVMIFRAGLMLFYRCKSFAFGGDEGPEAGEKLIHRELQTSLMYYQEKLLGRGLSRAYMRLVGLELDRVAPMFEGAPLASPPELIDVGRIVGIPGRITSMGPQRASDVLQSLAPVVGAALGRNAS